MMNKKKLQVKKRLILRKYHTMLVLNHSIMFIFGTVNFNKEANYHVCSTTSKGFETKKQFFSAKGMRKCEQLTEIIASPTIRIQFIVQGYDQHTYFYCIFIQ